MTPALEPPPISGPGLEIRGLTKTFSGAQVVSDVSFEIDGGGFLTLLGASGSGKTTTLRMIAGFETPTAGRILVGGRDIVDLPPQRRNIGVVFQQYALLPRSKPPDACGPSSTSFSGVCSCGGRSPAE